MTDFFMSRIRNQNQKNSNFYKDSFSKKIQSGTKYYERNLIVEFLTGNHCFEICLKGYLPFMLSISKLLDIFYNKYSFMVSFNLLTSKIEIIDKKMEDIQETNKKIMQYITSIVDKISVLAEIIDENKK